MLYRNKNRLKPTPSSTLLCALCTGANYLDRLAFHREASAKRLSRQGLYDLRGGTFLDFTALPADKKDGFVRLFTAIAADEGVEALHPVDQPLLGEKFQGPVHCGWLGIFAILPNQCEQVIGLDSAVIRPDQLQYLSAQGRQPYPPFPAKAFGGIHGGEDATVVVVSGQLGGNLQMMKGKSFPFPSANVEGWFAGPCHLNMQTIDCRGRWSASKASPAGMPAWSLQGRARTESPVNFRRRAGLSCAAGLYSKKVFTAFFEADHLLRPE